MTPVTYQTIPPRMVDERSTVVEYAGHGDSPLALSASNFSSISTESVVKTQQVFLSHFSFVKIGPNYRKLFPSWKLADADIVEDYQNPPLGAYKQYGGIS